MSTPEDLTESSRSPSSQQSAPSSEFPYAALGYGVDLHPVVELQLVRPSDGGRFPMRALVDSGAHCSVFPEEFAEFVGVDLETCEQIQVHTGNGLAIHYRADEPLRTVIAGRTVLLTATFGPVGIAILGRDDFFTEFYVEIDEMNRIVVITPHDHRSELDNLDAPENRRSKATAHRE